MGDDVKVVITLEGLLNATGSARCSIINMGRCQFNWDDIPHEFQELIKEKIKSQWQEALGSIKSTKGLESDHVHGLE